MHVDYINRAKKECCLLWSDFIKGRRVTMVCGEIEAHTSGVRWGIQIVYMHIGVYVLYIQSCIQLTHTHITQVMEGTQANMEQKAKHQEHAAHTCTESS
jgi:hypothetical protein